MAERSAEDADFRKERLRFLDNERLLNKFQLDVFLSYSYGISGNGELREEYEKEAGDCYEEILRRLESGAPSRNESKRDG